MKYNHRWIMPPTRPSVLERIGGLMLKAAGIMITMTVLYVLAVIFLSFGGYYGS